MNIFKPFRRFRTSEDGTMAVEAIIAFPILLWAFGAMFIFFDAFKAQNTNVKATFTVADLISRQADPLNDDFIEGARDIYEYLIRVPDSGDITVTVVTWDLGADEVTEELQIVWSYATGEMVAFTDPALLLPIVPTLSVGEQLIVVHSTMDWTPIMNFGLSGMELNNVAFSSPRFVPQILWDNT